MPPIIPIPRPPPPYDVVLSGLDVAGEVDEESALEVSISSSTVSFCCCVCCESARAAAAFLEERTRADDDDDDDRDFGLVFAVTLDVAFDFIPLALLREDRVG